MDAIEHHHCDPDELARRAKAGDLATVDLMTRCFSDRLMAVGRRRCRTESEAEDAVQDALVAAIEHLDSFRGDGRIDAWLSTLVARACGRLRRGRKNDPAWHTTDAIPLDPDADPELAAARAELAGAIAAAMDCLQPMDRALVILSDVQGWKGPELAARVDLKPDAVRARLSRARKKLRSALSEAHPTLAESFV